MFHIWPILSLAATALVMAGAHNVFPAGSRYATPPAIQSLINKESKKTVIDLIKQADYPSETHTVQTEDGYILTMHRIPRTNKDQTGPENEAPQNNTKGVVFLMHGLLSSSADWVVMGPGRGLAFILSDAGYDVWMGNARGNTYSKNHTSIKTKKAKFWQFSWHEIGMHDLPAMIDYVLEVTGEKKLTYAGHSQGTTSFFVMTSEKPEYNDKIKSMHALAPVAYMSNMKSPLIRALSPLVDSIELVAKFIRLNEFMPSSKFLTKVAEKVCRDESHLQFVCSNTLFLLAGFNKAQLNMTALPRILSHVPAGAASRQVIHYVQLVNSAKFRQFDHGLIKNKIIYGTIKPPAYNLTKVTCPIALHYSDNDWMAHTKDVDILAKQLPNVVAKYRIPDPKFNHLDFLWGIDADDLLYQNIVSTMNRYAK